MINNFADIILPIAVKGTFTYSIPDQFSKVVKPGIRVIVRFGNRKIYKGIVCKVHNATPWFRTIRPIMELADHVPVANEKQLAHWR